MGNFNNIKIYYDELDTVLRSQLKERPELVISPHGRQRKKDIC